MVSLSARHISRSCARPPQAGAGAVGDRASGGGTVDHRRRPQRQSAGRRLVRVSQATAAAAAKTPAARKPRWSGRATT